MPVKTYIASLLMTGTVLLAPTLAAPISAAPPEHPLFNKTTPSPPSSKLPEHILSECYSSCWSSHNQDPAEAVHCLSTCEERHKPLSQVSPHKKRFTDIDIDTSDPAVPNPPEVNTDEGATATANANASTSSISTSAQHENCASICARRGSTLCTTVFPDHTACMEICLLHSSHRVLQCALGGGEGFKAKSTEVEVRRKRQLIPPRLLDPDLGGPALPGSPPGMGPSGEVGPLELELLAWLQSPPEGQGLADGEFGVPEDVEEEEEEDTPADGDVDATTAARRL